MDFVERYHGRRNGSASAHPGRGDGRGGHNKKDPTEEMIAFALMRIIEEGETSQREVRRFHKKLYGTDCGSRRAQETIDMALERRKSKTEEVTMGQQSV